MSEKKKKTYFVKFQVNMDANEIESVIVKATKPHIAIQKAKAELRDNGFFFANVLCCNELNGGNNNGC